MRYFPSILKESETEEFYNRIQDEFNQNGWGLYAVEVKSTGEFIGYVGLHEIGFEADFSSRSRRSAGVLPLIITIMDMQPRLRNLY